MAQSRRKKKQPWLQRVLLFVVIPFSVWLLAFLVWFNWSSLENLFSSRAEGPAPSKAIRRDPAQPSDKAITRDSGETRDGSQKSTTPAESRPKEKISDDDRKKLDEILKGQR